MRVLENISRKERRERVTNWMMCLPRSFKSAQAVHDVASLQGALARPALAKFHVPIYRSSQQGRQCQDGTLNAVHGGGFLTGIF